MEVSSLHLMFANVCIGMTRNEYANEVYFFSFVLCKISKLSEAYRVSRESEWPLLMFAIVINKEETLVDRHLRR